MILLALSLVAFVVAVVHESHFYSTSDQGGDEVLELAADNDVGILTGVTGSLAHHSWHKQELFKGRGLGVGAGATDWSGWNIEENWLGINKISVSQAQGMEAEDFRTNTVFYCYPSSMNSTNITLLWYVCCGRENLRGRINLIAFDKLIDVAQTNVWLGFDMERMDFVKPIGNGNNVDFEIKAEWDGLPAWESKSCSADFSYAERLVRVVDRNGDPHTTKIPFVKDSALVTRTRCVIDEEGKIKAANYGCIRRFEIGPSRRGVALLRLTYVAEAVS